MNSWSILRLMDFDWIVDQEVGGMSQPYSAEDFHFLKESAAVDTIISLTGSGPPKDLADRFHVRVHHFHVPDMTPPTIPQMDSIVRAIAAELEEDRRVAVHCGAGLGRTGTVLACYLVSRGHSASGAIASVRRKRPGSIETAEQELFVSEYEQHLRRKGRRGDGGSRGRRRPRNR